MKFFLRWLISAVAIFIVPFIVPGVEIANFYSAIIAAAFIGIVNALIRPVLIVLTLPITIATLGLWTLVINAILFWFASSIIQGFHVQGFIAAFLGALTFWAISFIGNVIFRTK